MIRLGGLDNRIDPGTRFQFCPRMCFVNKDSFWVFIFYATHMIQANDPQLYRAYCLKESLRLLLKSTDVKQAEADLKHWFWWASHSRIPAFKELYQKIKRHKEHILNTIRLGLSNARIEATNNKIKLIIRKAYGFRNIQNMMDMVYLVCSDIRIPLPSRKSEPQKAA